MDLAKIRLSQEELLLVQNAEWLLTKNRIIEKAFAIFGSVATEVQNIFAGQDLLWPEVLAASPKIFKGENYKGLPYVMLDYPRSFGKQDIFAIRTMFWWGNFFSTTLHVKGQYKRYVESLLKDRWAIFKDNEFYIGIHADEWRHDFESDNYILLLEADMQTVMRELLKKDFCKLSRKVPLKEWDDAPVKLVQLYRMIIDGIMVNSPTDGISL